MSEKSIRIDDASTTVTYIGEAAIGMSEASPFWKIKKLTTTGTILDIKWADGNEEFDNVWTNRAALTYE